MALLKWLVLAAVTAIIAVCIVYFNSDDGVPPQMVTSWWGKVPKAEMKEDNSAIRPYVINVSNEVLKDLHDRLSNVRLPTSLKATEFEYGFRSDYLKEVIEYWKTKYSWSKYQAKLNSFPMYVTNIDGIDVHFLRILPSSNVGQRRAIMLIHGWPGTFWEFYKVIPLLTEIRQGTKQQSVALEVICPSIPGYGFSEAPNKPGFDVTDAAQIFYKLMSRLGHEKFYVHGGDWGGAISTIMAKAYPSNVIGAHLNMAFTTMSPGSVISRLLIGEFIPSLIYTPAEREIKMPLRELLIFVLEEMGYAHLQATKPDTVAVGLNDSPAGLVAYILEKFSTWTNKENRKCSDGCITKYFTLDEVLTNVMIYWLSGSVGSSVRFYKEYFTRPKALQWEKVAVTVPCGVAAFPHEIIPHTRSIVSLFYHNIVQYTNMPRGGHFPALEEPQLLADDIISFVKIVEGLQ